MAKTSTITLGLNAQAGSITDRAAQFISNIHTRFRAPVWAQVKSNHRLQVFSLTEITFCANCRQTIWIYGLRCKQCKLTIHEKCLDNLENKCVKFRTENSLVSASHDFKDKRFRTFTYCWHCGVLIVGLGLIKPQGLECKRSGCGMSVHYDCKDLVCRPCCQGIVKRISTQQSEPQERRTTASSTNWSNISIEDFDLICLLGRGSFSKVFLAKLRNNEKEFAIKVLKKSTPDPESALTEMKVLNFGRQHPFLTVVHYCFQTVDRLYYVMEYVPGRSLFYHLIKSRKFTEDKARFYAAEVVLALSYLHRRGVVYRDLKLDNIILDKDGHCKLIDFGMTKELSIGGTTRTFCGTPSYMSPETIKMHEYGFSVDWWSLGILIFEMLLGFSPFGESAQDDEALYQEIVSKEVEIPRYLSYEARSILDGLLIKDPVNRLGCNTMRGCERAIFDHPFFTFPTDNYAVIHQWDNLSAKRIEPPYKPTGEEIGRPEYCETETLSLTPIRSAELKGFSQADFVGFSFCSESFSSILQNN